MNRYIVIFITILVMCSSVFAQTWVKKVSGSGLGNSLTYNPRNLNTVYGSPNSQTLWVSYDRGDVWQQLATISGGSGITGAAVSMSDTNVILVGQKGTSGSDRVMRSSDHGVTWTQTWTGTFSYYGVPIETKPEHPDTVLVMSGTTIYRSTDFGLTWNTLTTTAGFNVWCDAEINPANANIVLVGDNTAGIFKSTDGGVTWVQKYTTTGEIPMIAWDPFKPNVAYATKWSGGGGFVKSTDYGDTWQAIPTFNGQNMWSVACAVAAPTLTMTCSYSGQNMRFSYDDGTTWVLRNTGLAGAGYGALVLDTLSVFALQGDGIYKYVYGPPAIPPVPSLVFPANGATNLLPELALSWNPSAGATSYHVQLAADSLFASRIVDDSTLTSTSRNIGPLQDTTRYYWRVRARNSSGSSAFSSRWTFRTGSTVETRTDLVPDGGGYIFSASHSTLTPRPPYEWIEAGPGTGSFVSGTNSDDFLSNPIALPSPFYFYGSASTQFIASTNGWLTFNIADTTPAYSEVAIPATGLPDRFIAPLWDDLRNHPGIAGSGIYTRSTGSRFVIEWYKMRRYDTGGEDDTLTFQVTLNYDDSTIALAYAQTSGGSFVYGAAATQSSIGIEGDGSTGNGSGYYFQGDRPLNKAVTGTLIKFSRRIETLGPVTPPSIRGRVFVDQDAQLSTSGDRNALSGRLIRLFTSGALVSTVLTNGSGEFSFPGLSPGTYDVCDDSGNGWISLGAITGSGGAITAVTSSHFRISVAANDSSAGNEFILVVPSMISGSVVQDFDGDTLTSADRLFLANRVVHRNTSLHAPLDSTLTDTSGVFRFGPITGGDFLLGSDTSGGWEPILAYPGTGAHAASVVDGGTIGVTLWSGDTVSGAMFVWYHPGLKMVCPDGGELWKGGEVHDIRWARPAGMHVSLEYSGNNGASWNSIVSDLPDTVLKFPWLVPFTQTTQALVRIVAADSSGATDISDATFGIESSSLYAITAGWNLLALPCAVPDRSIGAVYPGATSRAFVYRSGYTGMDSVNPGEGYWLKYDAPAVVAISGIPILQETLEVAARWNIIGGVSRPVAVSQISSIPPGIVTSQFYEFSGKYRQADSLLPGLGYWVKTAMAGRLVVGDQFSIMGSMTAPSGDNPDGPQSRLIVTDAVGRQQELLFMQGKGSEGQHLRGELPPLPPAGTFDVRFSPLSGDDAGSILVTMLDRDEYEIALQSAVFPLRCSFELCEGWGNGIELTEKVNGELLAVHPAASPGGITIANSSVKLALRSTLRRGSGLPAIFALEQNYPNPFNPTTRISYGLPVSAHVTLTLFNVIGQKVATFVDEMQEAGYRSFDVDARNLASGVYFYRILARPITGGGEESFVDVRRMILAK